MRLLPWRGRRPTKADAWFDVSVTDLDRFPDAIHQIYAGEIDGMTIRGAFGADEVATAVERLWGHRDDFVDHGSVQMFGTAIVGSDDDRALYHRAAPAMAEALETLFPNGFCIRIEDVLGRVGSGRQPRVPDDGPARTYVPATVRVLPAGSGVIHAHTANEFCNVWPAYEHLRRTARMWNSLSYFVTAQAPESGGGLMLYDLDWDDTPEDVLALPMGPERDAALERFDGHVVEPGPGDIVLFTGGRIWHRVEPVGGTVPRVTVGGFVAEATAGDEVVYWS